MLPVEMPGDARQVAAAEGHDRPLAVLLLDLAQRRLERLLPLLLLLAPAGSLAPSSPGSPCRSRPCLWSYGIRVTMRPSAEVARRRDRVTDRRLTRRSPRVRIAELDGC